MEVTHSQFSSYAAWYKQYENSWHGSEAVPAMVKIPYRMMLDVLLETLGLPPAEYRTRVYDGSRVCVTVLFHTPTSYVGNDRNRMVIPGVQSVDHSMSEDSAAMEAIGYIKCTVKTEIREYNYSTMKKLEEENRSLEHELNIARYNKKKMKTKIRSIKNKLMIATYEKKQNAMGWFVLTRYTHGLSDHISNIAALNMSSGKGPVDKIINDPLINIEKVAQRLKRRVINSEKKLRAIRMGF
ncbi:hypothetical protein ACQJBY_068806 [Aegilops geniculata]